VWQGPRSLLDGYTRFGICIRHGIPFRTFPLALPDRRAAMGWILAHQTGQRNLGDNGRTYTIGKRYLLEVQPPGGDRRREGASGQSDHLKTERRLAREYGVSDRTVRRAAEFAAAVDRVAGCCGHEAKHWLLGREAPLSRTDVELVSHLGAAEQRQTLEDVRKGTLTGPLARKSREGLLPMRLPRDVDGALAVLLAEWGEEKVRQLVWKAAAQLAGRPE
jgi:hypothetical protein